MRHTEHKEDRIEVYFRGKKIFEIEDTDFGVEAYDYCNRRIVDTKYQWLYGVYEETKLYVDALIDSLTDNPPNDFVDEARKRALELEQVLKGIRKEIWNE